LEAVEKEKSVEQVLKDIIDVRSSRASAAGTDAGTQKEFNASGYSLGLAIKQLLEGEGYSGVVKEMNQEMERQYGKKSKDSVSIPFHLLQRAVTIGDPASAGDLKPTTITTSYIDALYNEMVLVKAGATYLTGLVGSIDIPRFNNVIDPEFVAENGEAADSEMDVELVRLDNKTVTANMLISRLARMQTPQNLEALASDQLVRAIRQKMDIQGLIGAGGLAPTGLLNQAGVQTLTAGTTVSWQDVLDLEAAVKSKNAMVGRGSYITTSKIESKLKGTQKANALGFIAEGGQVNGYQLLTTNALPSSTGTNRLIFGDFSQLLIGTWGGLELDIDRYFNTAKGIHQIVAFFDYDVAVKRPEAFCFKAGITE
jgi:HK97 family phage major capsid protein